MLRTLTRTKLSTAGRLLALVYLFCVLAPALSFALGDETRVARSLTENAHHRGGVAHVHEHATAGSDHGRGGDFAHDHSGMPSSGDEAGETAAIADPSALVADHHESSGGQCCGTVCLSALPAKLADFVRPAAPRSTRVWAHYLAAASDTASQLYRPPIS